MVRPLLSCFDVTWAGRVKDGKSEVAAYFLKPARFVAELLGTERELLLVYSPYPALQARAIALHDSIASKNAQRLDPLGSILVSPSDKTRAFVKGYLDTAPERPPIVALSSQELQSLSDATQVRQILIDQLFRRDLFGLESPLRTDTLFFGRQKIVTELLDRFRSGQSSGLFGLRRIGKTSVLYALGRRCEGGRIAGFAYLDTSSPGLYKGRWWKALQRVIEAIADPFDLRRGERSHIRGLTVEYDEENAAGHFKADIDTLRRRMPEKRLLLALDEVEHLTFDISPSSHWAEDALPFWQTLRSVHQDTSGSFCFVLTGVNPRLLEEERIGRHDNPLFSTVRPYYLRPFDQAAVREMVRRLSRYMGLKCDEELYRSLTEEYGGHPFLVRQACSQLCRLVPDRPGQLGQDLFQQRRDELNRTLEKNVRQILNVLAIWYPDEYEMIGTLARGDVETFRNYAKLSAEFTEHMDGYGLVVDPLGTPKITMKLVESYLERQRKAEHPTVHDKEQVLVEITTRRNMIERALRKVLQDGLRFAKGSKAADALLQTVTSERRSQLSRFSYLEVWEHLYFAELTSVVDRHWGAFQNWFSDKKETVVLHLEHINRSRVDAHARELSEDDLAFLRVCFRRMEETIGSMNVARA